MTVADSDRIAEACDAAHAIDVGKAREAVRTAIEQALALWVPAIAIRDALIEELASLDQSGEMGRSLAAHLRALADRLEGAAPFPNQTAH
jgi:predicted RNase H-like HicB family nuclease